MGTIEKYIDDRRGNFAMMFSIVALVLVGGAAVAIDVTNMTRQAERYQSLADAAVLAAAASGETAVGQLRAVAVDTVTNNNFTGESLTTKLTILEDNTIQVEVIGDSQFFFADRLGFRTNDKINAIAEAPPKGTGKLNLSLVLDTTGSMSGTKITALKSAAQSLVTSLASETADEVMISVVPFARYTKIPTSYLGETWLQVHPTELHCWDTLDVDASTGCEVDDDDEDGDMECENPVYVEQCETLSWNGCMMSREAPWHTRAHYGGSPAIGFAGGGSCDNELLPLTNDFTAVSNKISSLDAGDETYIPSGLIWGWRTLTPEAPMIEAAAVSSADRRSALVLMTDGMNTRSYGGTATGKPGVYHWQSDQAAADSLTAEMCLDIKYDEITVYTVAFEVTDVDTITLLRNCASDPDKFFDAGDEIALQAAFEDIGLDLASVRLSR